MTIAYRTIGWAIIAAISSMCFYAYAKEAVNTSNVNYALLSFCFTPISLVSTYMLLIDKKNSILFVTTFVRAMTIFGYYLMGIFLFGQAFTWTKLLGIFVVLFGTYLVEE